MLQLTTVRLIVELQAVIEKHLEELEAAEDQIFDVDEVMGRIEAEMENQANW